MSSVSFVVPVFNKSSYIKHVVNSISSQKGDFDKEYIFIDDGSTDDSLKILKKETRKLKNCTIVSQKNKGSANATNVGINLAKMKYIKFLDADDVILSNATFCLLNFLEKNQESVLAYGLQRKVENIKLVDLEEEIDSNDYQILYNPILLAMRNSMFNPSQFLVRRELCQKVGAKRYISGPFGRDYLDTKAFKNSGIDIQYHDYTHPTYSQAYDGFESHMSIIDLLFNHGKGSLDILKT